MIKVGDICRARGNTSYLYRIEEINSTSCVYRASQFYPNTFLLKALPVGIIWSPNVHRGGSLIGWEVMSEKSIASKILDGEI